MNSRFLLLAGLGVTALLPVSASAEDNPVPAVLPTAPARASVELLTAAQLDELVGPIALHPDALVALILPAAGAPSDIVLAARYVSAGGLIAKVDEQPWDDSVKSLARYPDIVQWMDENLAWTKQLGETFNVQPADVMKAIQRMRAKARALGTLKDTPQQRVEVVENTIRIVPVEREVIYVPYYDPEVVYIEHRNYGSPFITFSAGFAAGYWLAYDFDWHVNTIWVVNPRDRDRCWRDHRDWHRWTPPPPTHYHDRPRRDPTPDFCHEWRPRHDSRPRPGRVVHGPAPDIVRPTLPIAGGYSGNRDNGRWNGRRDDNNDRRDDRDRRGNDANANNGNRSRSDSDRNRNGNGANNPRQNPTPPANTVQVQTTPADVSTPVAAAPAQPTQPNNSSRQGRDRSDRRSGEPRNPNPPNNPGSVTVLPNPTPTPAPVTVVPTPTTPAPDASRSTRIDQRRERGDRTDRYARNNDGSNSQRSAPSQPSYTPPSQSQNNPPTTVTRSAPQPSQPRQEYSQPPRQERSQPRNESSQQSQPSQPRQEYSQPRQQERMHPRQETVARLRESPPPPPPPPPPAPAQTQTENKSSTD